MKIVKLECESIVPQPSWDELAEKFSGSFFHCHAYGPYASCGSNEKPLYVKALDDNGECIGIAVGTIVTPRFWPFSRFCKRAVFGALPATNEPRPYLEQAIMAALEKRLKRFGVFQIHVSAYGSCDSAKVLSDLFYKLYDRAEFYIDLSRSIEDLWNMLKQTKRTNVRRAQKLGVETKVESSRAAIEHFLKFQSDSLQRRDIATPSVSRQLEASISALLHECRVKLLVSYQNGTPLNAGLFGIFGGKAYYLGGGSSLDGNRSRGPVHLVWTAIEMLKREGSRVLNLGGVSVADGGELENGLYNFKHGFGGIVIPQPAGLKTISRFGAILSAARDVCKTNFRF